MGLLLGSLPLHSPYAPVRTPEKASVLGKPDSRSTWPSVETGSSRFKTIHDSVPVRHLRPRLSPGKNRLVKGGFLYGIVSQSCDPLPVSLHVQ